MFLRNLLHACIFLSMTGHSNEEPDIFFVSGEFLSSCASFQGQCVARKWALKFLAIKFCTLDYEKCVGFLVAHSLSLSQDNF